MPVFKFRVYWEDDDGVYRDIVIKPEQSFAQFHEAILQAFNFDNRHRATFFKSNDNWLRGREIILEKDDQRRKVEPLLMVETAIGSAIKHPDQKFIYLYDFVKQWTFLVELINVAREEDMRLDYPTCVRSEGLAPSQYGNKGHVNEKLVEMEEKYDLNANGKPEGFSEEGEEDVATDTEEEEGYDEEEQY